MTTQRISTHLDLNIGEQELLQRILDERESIAKLLARGDVREEARIEGLLAELSEAFAQGMQAVMEGAVKQQPEREHPSGREFGR